MDDKAAINWAVYAADVNLLALRIRTTIDPTKINAIIAISRGGLVPAAMLAHKLKVREIDTLDIRSYDDTHEQQNLVVHRTCDVDYLIRRGKGLIVVDDLIDSGNTIREAKQLLPEAHIAVVYVKPKGEELADFYARRVPQKTWIEFPYE